MVRAGLELTDAFFISFKEYKIFFCIRGFCVLDVHGYSPFAVVA